MAHIQRRGQRGSYTYRARYIDPDGRERSKSFPRKADAEMFLTSVSHSLLAGSYVDPIAGRTTFGAYAQEWMRTRAHRHGTRSTVASKLNRHVLPVLGPVALADLRRSRMQEWVNGLTPALSESTAARDRGHRRGHPESRCDGQDDPRIPDGGGRVADAAEPRRASAQRGAGGDAGRHDPAPILRDGPRRRQNRAATR
jgi:hypothetical protein